MKKILCMVLALVLCMSLATTAMAADVFVPSIGDKNEPDVVGKARLINGDGVVDEVPDSHLVITSVAKALKGEGDSPAEAKAELVSVYESLKNGSMSIPYSKVDASIDAADMEIRDLFDISLICTEENSHKEQLAKGEIDIELTLDLGVKSGDGVVIMTYVNGEWVPAKSISNNGDGTVTCKFAEICPVVVCVKDTSAPPQTGDLNRGSLVIWGAALGVSAIALVALFVIYRKKNAAK